MMEQKSDCCDQSNLESLKLESEIGNKVDRVSTSNVDSGIQSDVFDISLNVFEAEVTLNSSFDQTLSDEETICSSFNKIYDYLTR